MEDQWPAARDSDRGAKRGDTMPVRRLFRSERRDERLPGVFDVGWSGDGDDVLVLDFGKVGPTFAVWAARQAGATSAQPRVRYTSARAREASGSRARTAAACAPTEAAVGVCGGDQPEREDKFPHVGGHPRSRLPSVNRRERQLQGSLKLVVRARAFLRTSLK